MNEKAFKLIRPVLKRDQVVASFKEAILSGAKLRALMRDSISDWRTEVFNAALPRESE